MDSYLIGIIFTLILFFVAFYVLSIIPIDPATNPMGVVAKKVASVVLLVLLIAWILNEFVAYAPGLRWRGDRSSNRSVIEIRN